MVAGRNAVLEAMEAGIPTKTAYVSEGAERDDRLRDIFKLAADRGTPLLEVTRVELDRLTGGAGASGRGAAAADLRVRPPRRSARRRARTHRGCR
jgi:tRNA G18 (ribose-2'-O)-methylase SpoU